MECNQGVAATPLQDSMSIHDTHEAPWTTFHDMYAAPLIGIHDTYEEAPMHSEYKALSFRQSHSLQVRYEAATPYFAR
jgi:hypothetical protein